MKTLKKTTLIAAITAMAAFAGPSMASAAVWGPLNTNQSLDSTAMTYAEATTGPNGWTCTGQHLGVHVRTPASSTLDITSASWTGCQGYGGWAPCPITMTPTGLPWTATGLAGGAQFTVHAQVTFGCNGWVYNLDGTVGGVWNASTHTFTFSGSSGLRESIGGTPWNFVTVTGSLRNPTQTLTLT